MTEETIRCDRCKKIINKQLFNIILYKPKVFVVRFSDRSDYSATNHDLCYDCYNELINWFNQK